MSDRCQGDPYAGIVHICDDPAGCAVDRLISEPSESDLGNLRDTVAEVRDLVEQPKWAKTKLGKMITEVLS